MKRRTRRSRVYARGKVGRLYARGASCRNSASRAGDARPPSARLQGTHGGEQWLEAILLDEGHKSRIPPYLDHVGVRHPKPEPPRSQRAFANDPIHGRLPVAELSVCESRGSDGPTAGTDTVDPLEFLARVTAHIPNKHQVLTPYGGGGARSLAPTYMPIVYCRI